MTVSTCRSSYGSSYKPHNVNSKNGSSNITSSVT